MIVLDTHALVWWVSASERLSRPAVRAIRSALRSGPVAIATISILEIVTAVRRGRLQLSMPVDRWLDDVRALPELDFRPLSFDIARAAASLGEAAPGDPADRIIVATAAGLGAKLVTADKRLAGIVATVW